MMKIWFPYFLLMLFGPDIKVIVIYFVSLGLESSVFVKENYFTS